ncbi:leucine-rich repeat and coiled-coil domain-containing protein PF3D7_0703800 [Hydra vulgaris]|uniref:leucine-rich repeat and coiled-coil domain-containing protein PF3D7_0703800 n=1 Tax=Hydra vulgaris TaxID=6087 RepID=UPI0006412971|nr:leucine-rich repeat and coiled-coil domain-containing protein PF3D7_0703800-like [Hydra vulgaris]XP_047143824.1 leucine-rich repeat and coiled-coil domain-containing protein PF3D7_0703800-like [Hydra vulgaris]XP_047143826.1 leucine-rich repeat and coiled-coil domain-containing protein PF3D7_0703800-like [Hydra vulgaris]XP_047143827.1 leucine-rich repeat and coiled-coil domain-containing protein PF3D7_0703800-like [Hydra vulgaris]XP_047143828.1 leucine-rich repeat and coiled-coil domain-conta
MEKIKKHFTHIFKSNNLLISIQCNIKIVNFLDVTLNLIDSSYQPYCKPNNQLMYVHSESNHPPNIIKEIPRTIELRLLNMAVNEIVFNNSIIPYEEALRKSGYNSKLTYQLQINKNQKRHRIRKIIWYNPPFSKNVETKIGNRFLALIDQHFPVGHRLHKIFNRNYVKVSYSCMPNVKSLINTHNNKILHSDKNKTSKKCNCIDKNICPLNNQCLFSNIVYQATVSSGDPQCKDKVYFGISETTFKLRYANHLKSFNAPKYKNDTELSKELWELKSKHINPVITWKIIAQCKPYNQASKVCNLCLREKFHILSYKGENLLNKRYEIISKCRHSKKFLLSLFDTGD